MSVEPQATAPTLVAPGTHVAWELFSRMMPFWTSSTSWIVMGCSARTQNLRMPTSKRKSLM